jgi:transcriptional regulator with XRE-family HTH domain
MSLIDQIKDRQKMTGKTVREIASVVGMDPANVYRVLRSPKDVRESTLEGLAGALDAKWMLVPKHLLPEVERLISGKAVGLDDSPSSLDMLFGENRG